MAERELATLLKGYSLTTAEILYRLPDHPALLQSYIWQDYDMSPRFPKLLGFLDFWSRNLDGKLFKVTVAHCTLVKPARAPPGRRRGAVALTAGPSRRSSCHKARAELRPGVERLKHHAVSLGQLQELIQLLLRRVRIDLEAQPNGVEAHLRGLVHAERAAEIEVALREHVRALIGTPMAVATAFSVTPAQATSASSSMSPEQSSAPEPPVAGCSRHRQRTARFHLAGDRPVVDGSCALSVRAAPGSDLYFSFSGACKALSASPSMPHSSSGSTSPRRRSVASSEHPITER